MPKVYQRLVADFTIPPTTLTPEFAAMLRETMAQFGFHPGQFDFDSDNRGTLNLAKALWARSRVFSVDTEYLDGRFDDFAKLIRSHDLLTLNFGRDFNGYGWNEDDECSIFEQTWGMILGFDKETAICDEISLWTDAEALYPPSDGNPDNFDYSLVQLAENLAIVLHNRLLATETHGWVDYKYGTEKTTLFFISAKKNLRVAECDPNWIRPIRDLSSELSPS
ncbi:hypothetical protein OJ996_15515 [Luteolibacter sp. GHJ8]|uniref:Uncharacterized protein n=1 Tax=Luteolibacter rhizosphaerae TaxID=2989719 RepID=A0ABT3G575_9BACT|nr:hypothetical protein [Luteolibacter rhizosphaerae]MCW1914995.1 hypothetical protein [Luteolibacter rhizosphaerae]